MDQQLLFYINREWTGAALDRVMAVMSSATAWAGPLAVAGLCVLVWGGFRGRAFMAVAALALGLSDGVVCRTLKQATNRMRPAQSEPGVRILELARPVWSGLYAPLRVKRSRGDSQGEEGRSFPSSHSANTMAVAVTGLLFFRLGWLLLLPALLVSYSRIYTGAHWPTDVLAGIIAGAGAALLAVCIAEFSWRRWRATPGRPSLFS